MLIARPVVAVQKAFRRGPLSGRQPAAVVRLLQGTGPCSSSASSWQPWRTLAARAEAGSGHDPEAATSQAEQPAGDGTSPPTLSTLPTKRRRRRLDELCISLYPHFSRSIIQSWIIQGKVLVRGQPVYKAGAPVLDGTDVRIIAEVPRYVCRAGYKLEGALQHFELDIADKVVLDAGLSTGGFTDCLLQHGAARVYGVDVGYGQVSERIRTHERVVVMERTNLRHLARLPEPVDLVTLDLSFISILLVMPAVCTLMKPDAQLVALIKPQFEARRNQVGGGGIVRDPKVHEEVISRVTGGIEAAGFSCLGCIPSPITGTDGNIEFLAHFARIGLERPASPSNSHSH